MTRREVVKTQPHSMHVLGPKRADPILRGLCAPSGCTSQLNSPTMCRPTPGDTLLLPRLVLCAGTQNIPECCVMMFDTCPVCTQQDLPPSTSHTHTIHTKTHDACANRRPALVQHRPPVPNCLLPTAQQIPTSPVGGTQKPPAHTSCIVAAAIVKFLC